MRKEPCLICGKDSEAHHIMYAEPRGVGLKVGDNWTVPILSRTPHVYTSLRKRKEVVDIPRS